MSFLHGIEFSTDNGLSPARVSNFSTVGLTGSAGQGPVNIPTLVISEDEGVRIFGLVGDIPKNLKRHFAKGPRVGYVVVVNVGHESQTITPVELENKELANGVATLTHGPVVPGSETIWAGETLIFAGVGTRSLFTATETPDPPWITNAYAGYTLEVEGEPFTVISNDESSLVVSGTPRTSDEAMLRPSVALVRNVDYVIDNTARTITRVTGRMTDNKFVASYQYITATGAVTNADIIGEVDAETGLKSGIQAMRDAEAVTGYKPKLLIAPGYSSAQGVMNALISVADLLRGRAIGDCAVGATKEQAKTYRDLFNNVNATIVYPTITYLSDDGESEIVGSGSTELAAVWSRVINEYGYWYSPSNHPVENVLATERPIDYIFDSTLCTASYLNEHGITTFVKRDGVFYVWGNLSVTNDAFYQFACVQMTRQTLQEAFVATLLKVIDLPMNRAWFENITDTMTVFLNSAVRAGAITAGSFRFLADDNPPEDMMQGIVKARWKWTPSYPAQEIDIIETLSIAELTQLFAA